AIRSSGAESPSEGPALGAEPLQAALTARSRAMATREPGQVRKEAALSDSRHVMRISLARAKRNGYAREPRLDDGCTVHFYGPIQAAESDAPRPEETSVPREGLPPVWAACIRTLSPAFRWASATTDWPW